MAEKTERHGREPPRVAWRRILVVVALLTLMIRRACRRMPRPDPVTPSGPRPGDVNRYGHEAPEVAWRKVLVIAGVLAMIVVVAVVGSYAMLHVWLAPHHAEVVARSAPIPPQPRLQPHPRQDLAAFRAAKHKLLSTWAWTDASHAYARIPVERAMAIYAHQHSAIPAPKANATQGGPRQ